MIDKALVTLTPEESRRLIARAIARMEVVESAKREGIIGFAMCTSAGFVAEEVLNTSLDLSRYCCGFIHGNGTCFAHPGEDTRELVLVKGEPKWLNWPFEDISLYIGQMGHRDVIIKSGNVLGSDGRAGCLVACTNGGEMGKYLPYIHSAGIQLIVPMTLNKSLPVNVDALSSKMGVTRIKPRRSYGMSLGILPLPGTVVTEIQALNLLSGVSVLPVAAGGFGSGEGTVTLLLEGESGQVDAAWNLVKQIKGEKKLANTFSDCRACVQLHPAFGMQCSTRRNFKK